MTVKAFKDTKPDDFGTMTASELHDWYEEHVGYRPQVDDPTMSESELRENCLSYWEYVTEITADQAT